MTEISDWSEASRVAIEMGPDILNLRYTLDCGQAFRWREGADGWWTGVVRGRAIRLRQEGREVLAEVFPPLEDAAVFLAGYLRLDVDLQGLYDTFGSVDPWISEATTQFAGLRVLGQEPEETLLSYVCSTANSVPRIAKAVREMSRYYGAPVATIQGQEYHAFPSAAALAEASPEILRNRCGLGWRGDNLKRVARDLSAMSAGWLPGLKTLSYSDARAELMQLRGIGAKIADCVCLFSLGKDEAVPVDTHIWAVARELFGADIPTRTLTSGTYQAIAGMFVRRYGAYAGWAQEYLYLHRRAAQGRVRSGLPQE